MKIVNDKLEITNKIEVDRNVIDITVPKLTDKVFIVYNPILFLGNKVIGVKRSGQEQKITFVEVAIEAGGVESKQLCQFDEIDGVVSEFDVSFWNTQIYRYPV
jgi:hypothetical protein